jgi:hypothetical protein
MKTRKRDKIIFVLYRFRVFVMKKILVYDKEN